MSHRITRGANKFPFIFRRWHISDQEDKRRMLDAVLSRRHYEEEWFGATAPPLSTFEKRLRCNVLPPHTMWIVSTRSGDVCASGRLVPFAPGAAWLSLYVVPEYRRKGIAREIFDQVVNISHCAGISAIQIETSSGLETGELFAKALGGRTMHVAQVLEFGAEALRGDMAEFAALTGATPDVQFHMSSEDCPNGWLEVFSDLVHALDVSYDNRASKEAPEVRREAVRRREGQLRCLGMEKWTAFAVVGTRVCWVQ